MKKLSIIIYLLFILYSLGHGQSNGITPLHRFFEKNADSTLIIEYDTHSYDPHYYHILTKTGDTINTFEYNAILKDEKVVIPKKLSTLIFLEKQRYFNAPAEINSYFNLVNLNRDTLKNMWGMIEKLDVWNLVDDKHYSNCPDNKRGLAVVDGGSIIVHLITHDKIKTLIYNIPWHYEKYCPGNKNRQSAIKLHELFAEKFPKG